MLPELAIHALMQAAWEGTSENAFVQPCRFRHISVELYLVLELQARHRTTASGRGRREGRVVRGSSILFRETCSDGDVLTQAVLTQELFCSVRSALLHILSLVTGTSLLKSALPVNQKVVDANHDSKLNNEDFEAGGRRPPIAAYGALTMVHPGHSWFRMN